MTDEPGSARIKLGISSCLLGQEVRYDGGHKRDRFIVGTLTDYFDFVPLCPEMAIGLGVPREPIRLQRKNDAVRVVGVQDERLDVTEQLRDYGSRMAEALHDISGYILKSKSPSCGMERVKVYPRGENQAPSADGIGQYAAALMAARPELPVEEEGRLCDPVLRENFVERVFTFNRWQDMYKRGISARRLVDFHTRHKLALLAHGQDAYRELGQLVATSGKADLAKLTAEYLSLLMRALKTRATRRQHTNVLQHILGYLKQKLDRQDKAELVDVIERYRLGQLPLVVPITLLKHHFRRHPNSYIQGQIYMNPHPPELMLRNLI